MNKKNEARAEQIAQDTVVRLEREFKDVDPEEFAYLVGVVAEELRTREQIAKEEAGL